MTVKELKEKLNTYPDDTIVVIGGEKPYIHYDLFDVDSGYDDDYEKDVVILMS